MDLLKINKELRTSLYLALLECRHDSIVFKIYTAEHKMGTTIHLSSTYIRLLEKEIDGE